MASVRSFFLFLAASDGRFELLSKRHGMIQQYCCAWRHECDSCFGACWGWMLDMD